MRKTVLLRAPVLTRSGYGEQSRFALRALRSREDLFDIYIHPIEWGRTSWINDNDEERLWIDERVAQTAHYIQNNGTFDISVQVTIPNEWQRLATHNVGYTAGMETTRVAHEWLQLGNEMDSLIVVSNHSKNVYENTTYEAIEQDTNRRVMLTLDKEVTAVNYPVKTYDSLNALEFDLEYDFNFVAVAQMGPRKNLFNTIKWFLEEFHDDEVGLVVKTNMARNCQLDREVVHGNLLGLLRSPEYANRKCKVYMLHGDLTDQEMHEIHLHPKIKAFVSLAHGEGFGLPIYEAAYMGTPVIATAWSGQLDFLVDEKGENRFYDVTFDLRPIPEQAEWQGVIVKDSMWAYPREASAKNKMRECYNDVINNNCDACNYAAELKERFAPEKMYAQFIDAMKIPAELMAEPEKQDFVEFE
jgi:glycosyltransferase involved in cell wall biosynthesis